MCIAERAGAMWFVHELERILKEKEMSEKEKEGVEFRVHRPDGSDDPDCGVGINPNFKSKDDLEIRVHGGKLEDLLSSNTSHDTIMQFFAYDHLPPHLQEVSGPFCNLAEWIHETLPRNAERTVALRKLLEAKDAAVRAKLCK